MRKIPLELWSISPGMQHSSRARDMEHTKTSFLVKKILNLTVQLENIPNTAGAVPWHPQPCVRWGQQHPQAFGIRLILRVLVGSSARTGHSRLFLQGLGS